MNLICLTISITIYYLNFHDSLLSKSTITVCIWFESVGTFLYFPHPHTKNMAENNVSVCHSYNHNTKSAWEIFMKFIVKEDFDIFEKQGCQIFYQNTPNIGVYFKFRFKYKNI